MTQHHEEDKRAVRGAPSYVWREGQVRRFEMIRKWGNTKEGCILVDGCGLGAYASHLMNDNASVYAFDIEHERAVTTRAHVPFVHVAAAEHVPYPDNTFTLILSHEVLEHVQDDQAAIREMVRVLRPGGRAVIFCPNRWYPFETHGHYWRGEYHFGNTPLINYLPDVWRNKLAPHVKVYRRRDLMRLIRGLPVRVVHHTRIFGGYDNIIARYPGPGKVLRSVMYVLEKTPLRVLGLSHLFVIEKVSA